jgi:hypothetical protein
MAQHFSHSGMFVFVVLVDDIPRSIYAFEEELGVLEAERLVCFAKSIAVFYGFGRVETQMVWCRTNNGAYKVAVSLILWLLEFTNRISCASYGSSMLLALRRDGKTTMPDIRQSYIQFIVVHKRTSVHPAPTGPGKLARGCRNCRYMIRAII